MFLNSDSGFNIFVSYYHPKQSFLLGRNRNLQGFFASRVIP